MVLFTSLLISVLIIIIIFFSRLVKVSLLIDESSLDAKSHFVMHWFNPFKPNELSYLYRKDVSILNFRGVRWYFSFIFNF